MPVTVDLGWLDTNIFVHAVTANDPRRARCLELIDALADGRATGWLAPAVAHELSYVLSRRQAFPTRGVIAGYVRNILALPGVLVDDKPLLVATVARWEAGTLGFVDALLTELAGRDNRPVCSVNARDFPTVPNSFATAAV